MAGFEVQRKNSANATAGYGYIRPQFNSGPPVQPPQPMPPQEPRGFVSPIVEGRMNPPEATPQLGQPQPAPAMGRVTPIVEGVATPEQAPYTPGQPVPVGQQPRPGRLAPESDYENTGKAVNAPVIRVTEEQIREMASIPALMPFVRQLIEMEKNGGAQLVSNPQRPTPAGPGSNQGGGPPATPQPPQGPPQGQPQPVQSQPQDPYTPGAPADNENTYTPPGEITGPEDSNQLPTGQEYPVSQYPPLPYDDPSNTPYLSDPSVAADEQGTELRGTVPPVAPDYQVPAEFGGGFEDWFADTPLLPDDYFTPPSGYEAPVVEEGYSSPEIVPVEQAQPRLTDEYNSIEA